MARHYASLVDRFIYFPIGKFPLVGDDMRPADEEYQQQMAREMGFAFHSLGVPQIKIHTLEALTIDDRVEEVLQVILR